MNKRTQLGLALILVIGLITVMLLSGSRDGALTLGLIGLLIVVPIFASRTAVLDLHRESAIAWFFLSWIPYVPILLLIEKRMEPIPFCADMKLGGEEPERYRLGELTHYFSIRSNSQLGLKIASLFLAIMLGPMLILPFIDGGKKDGFVIQLLPFVMIIILSVLFIWFINRQENRQARRFVALFRDGLLCAWPGTEIFRVPWQDIQEVWQEFRDQYVNGIRTVHRRRCRIVAPILGSPLEFSEKLQGIEDLTTRIHEQVTPHLLKRMEHELDSGERVRFGKLSLSKAGIEVKKDLLPWSELAGIYLDSGFVVIARLARSFSEARIRNTAQGFSAFATRIVGTAQPTSPGGDAVIWKKVSVEGTPNPVTLTYLAEKVLKKGTPSVLNIEE